MLLGLAPGLEWRSRTPLLLDVYGAMLVVAY